MAVLTMTDAERAADYASVEEYECDGSNCGVWRVGMVEDDAGDTVPEDEDGELCPECQEPGSPTYPGPIERRARR
jgi:hypothetical protein